MASRGECDHGGKCAKGRLFHSIELLRLKPHALCLSFRGVALRGGSAEEGERKKALTASRRGTGIKLGMPVPGDGQRLKHGRRGLELHQHNQDGSHGDRHCGMHGNADWAMVGSGCVRVEVRHLNDCQESEQNQTHHRQHGQRGELCAGVLAEMGVQSCQMANPYDKNTHNWTCFWEIRCSSAQRPVHAKEREDCQRLQRRFV